MRASAFVFLALLFVSVAELRAEPVSVTDLSWHDAGRNRDIAVRIYAPTEGTPPFPVIVFSHGLGGSEKGYAYLGNYWAAHGYVSVHIDHPGSDTALLQSTRSMQALHNALSVENMIARPKDISFAIDQLTRLNQEAGPWQGKFDLARLGMAGHSFGAYTTMAIAGEKPPADYPALAGLADPRVKAAVAMSVPGGARGPAFRADYSSVHIPVLHFTGTEDKIGILPDDAVAGRRIPFDESPGPDTYLVIFQGGDHMVFSGRGNAQERPTDPVFQNLVCRGSTAFWDAYLKGDAQAKSWLADGGFAAALGASGTFEKK